MLRIIFSCIISFLLLTGFRSAEWCTDKIDNQDGLSNSAVISIYMDSRGFMWFGTWDGLNRYDGSKIKVFKPDVFKAGSISNNIVRNIIEDKYKNLWIVTEDGINLYDTKSETFLSFFFNKKYEEYRENSYHVALDTDSVLWCSKYEYGLSFYDENKKQFSNPISIKNYPNILKHIINFHFSAENELWIISENGYVYGFKKEHSWKLFKKFNLINNCRFNQNQSWFFLEGNKLYVYIALYDGGLICLDVSTGQKYKILNKSENFKVTVLSESLSGDFLWGGTDGGRIFRMDTTSDHNISFIGKNLSDLQNKQIKIWSITETKPDLLWIGTDGDGVHKYIMERNYFTSVGKGNLDEGNINHNIVRAINEDSYGNIWVGTRGCGVNIIPKSGKKTRVLDTGKGLSNNAVLSLESDTLGNIWIGVDGEGIDMYEKATGKILHFPRDFIFNKNVNIGFVYTICRDSFGDLWLGTSGYGLWRLSVRKIKDGKYRLISYKNYLSNSKQKNGLLSNVIYSVVEGSPNVMWIGTRGSGLYRLNVLTDTFESFRSNKYNTNCLNNNDVISLWKSNKQELWIGTSGGLNRLDMSISPYVFSHYTERDGLPNNTIHSILGDKEGNVWVSTNNGLAVLNYNSGQVRSYYKSDGLQGNEYSDGAYCFGKHSGLFYFGGVNGFDYFDPAKIKDSDYFPRLAITGFSIFNQKNESLNKSFQIHVDLLDSLVLKYNQNFLKFNFVTLNYHNNKKCRYSYLLENFDKNYIPVENEENAATFTNIPPGNYSLKIKWTNEDGIWNKDIRQINLTILPPFWKTKLAYSIYVFLCLMLLFIAGFLFKRKLQYRHNMALERIEIQKNKEINQYKFRFFTDIAHEFRTPLSLIMAPAAQLMELLKDNPKAIPYIKSIYNNSSRLSHLINELIDFRKVETGHFNLKVKEDDFLKFVINVTDSFKQYSVQKKINLEVFKSQESIKGWFDKGVMEKILLNIISNAFKYTSENGNISVSIYSKGENAIVKVKDTGIGIPKEYLEKIFDRFFQRDSLLQKNREKVDSSGVGLSLTKSLIELHKGHISVESSPGVGSCFTVSIPISENLYSENEKSKDMVIEDNEIETRVNEEFSGLDNISYRHEKNIEINSVKKDVETVLIVDDNKQLINIISDILHSEYSILKAKNGMEAIEILNEYDVSVVVSDVIMPEMDGLTLCRNIKENIHTCHIPVILLTAKGETEFRIEGIESGADSYIPKPFSPAHLKVRIRKLLENRDRMQKAFQLSPANFSKNIHGLNNRDFKLLGKMYDFVIKQMADDELDADKLSEYLNMSKTQLYRKVKALTGFTPHGFIKNIRLKKVAQLLKESSLSVSEIIYETGFKNKTYFYRSFKELYGTSPMEYVKKINNSDKKEC